MDEQWLAGLPPVAAERVRRQAGSHVAGSLLSTSAVAALRSADLVPVGEVMGCVVMHLSWTRLNCGVPLGAGAYGFVTPVVVSSRRVNRYERAFGTPYLPALNQTYDTAIDRMLIEAAALGADGVVGARLTWTRLDSGARELLALGTAVSWRTDERRDRALAASTAHPSPKGSSRGGPRRAVRTASLADLGGIDGTGGPEPSASAEPGRRPFATELGGEDVSKAVLSGWFPLGIALGLAAAVKHEDSTMRFQRQSFTTAGNAEVTGLTELIHSARSEARQQLDLSARRLGRAGQIVISRAELSESEQSCGEEVDFRAVATFVGTALAYDPQHQAGGPPRSSLSIMPLRSRSEGTRPSAARR